jgi:predicted transcriptional regulator
MNLLGSNMELAEKKLILLYIIEKIDMPISNLHMTKIILENNYMNYFLMQQFLNELCESNLLSAETIDNKTSYLITGYGRQTLEYFLKLIPKGIKNRIDNTISSIRKNVRNETLITADFIPESENEYIASCSVHEDNFSLIDLQITVGTRNDARIICDNWKSHTQAIYAEIIEILTRKREEG